MTYDFAVEVGVDLIAIPTLLFVILYAFLPWWRSRLGWALMTHGVGSMLLFTSAVATQHGLLPEEYPGSQVVILLIILLWIVGWYLLVWALAIPRWQDFKAWRTSRRQSGVR